MSDRVFVCYAREDEEFVLQLAGNLKKKGIPIWLDQWDIPAGADWDRSIDNAICECAKFVIVLSPRAVDSSEVRGELRTAIDENRPIIPVIRTGCRVPRQLRTIQYVDFSSKGSGDEAALRQLVRTLETSTNQVTEETIREPDTPHPDRRAQEPWFQKLLAGLRAGSRRVIAAPSNRYALAGIALIISLVVWWQWPRTQKFEPLAPPAPPPAVVASPATIKAPEPKVVVGEKPVAAGESKEETKKLTTGGVGPVMVVVPAGSFQMGDLQGVGDKDELPVRSVQIPKSFALSRFEVTFDEYDAFAKATNRKLPDDQGWGRGRRPVINVSWEEAQAYAKWLSEQTGKRYRLPTEAKWEYAARSGGKQQIWSGTSDERGLADYSWFVTNSSGKTQEVGKKKANGFGLHDMSGNVWEWVEDCWHDNYNGAPTDGRAWKEENGGQCGRRVVRGGSWNSIPENLRSSNRFRFVAGIRFNGIGFRLAQDIE